MLISNSAKTHSFIFYAVTVLLLATPLTCLDFYFYSKFYDDGRCKPKTELANYIVQNSNNNTPKFDSLESLLLMREGSSVVNFGLYLSWKHKDGLQNAHGFFSEAFAKMTETQKTYFPDMVSCVTEMPWYSLFGIFDSYGLMYRVVPTLAENHTTDLSGNRYSLTDLADIYLDVFKGMQVVIQNNYYMASLDEGDIGVVSNVEDLNTHLRGKVRTIHKLRSGGDNCDASKMSGYDALKKLLDQQENRSDLHMLEGTVNPCQVMNLVSIWWLFMGSLKTMFQMQKEVTVFDFNNCVEDFVQRDACPESISKLWGELKVRKDLRRARDTALGLTSTSLVSFYIFVLTRMKMTYMEQLVTSEAQEVFEKLSNRVIKIGKIKSDIQTMDQIDELELKILNKEPQRRMRISQLDQQFQNGLAEIEINDSNEQSSELLNRLPESMRKEGFMAQVMAEIDNNSDLQRLTSLEDQRAKAIIDKENEQKSLDMELAAKKKEIQGRFRNIVRKVQVQLEKDKILKEQKAKELIDVGLNRLKISQSMTFEDKSPTQNLNIILTSPTKSESLLNQNMSIKLIQVDPLNSSQSTIKIKMDQKISKLNTGIEIEHSIKSSDISDYESSLSNQEFLLKSETSNPALLTIQMEEMVINTIQMDYDDDTAVNEKIINDFEQEVRENEKDFNLFEREDSVIIDDKRKALLDQELVLKHQMKEQVLETAETSIQKRECLKLTQAKDLFLLMDQLKVLVDQNKLENVKAIEEMKSQLIGMVGGMVDVYGRAENLTREMEGEQGLVHFTLGDLQDDMTRGEMEYIMPKNNLVANKVDLRLV